MIPNFFSKEPIPEEIPREMQELVDELKKTNSKDTCLRKAYDMITKRYRGVRGLTFVFFWRWWEHDIYRLFTRRGFLHCHQMNYLLRVMLVHSGWFTDDDISLEYSMVWYLSPHQHLKVKIDEETSVRVDPWFRPYGIGYDDYARGFH